MKIRCENPLRKSVALLLKTLIKPVNNICSHILSPSWGKRERLKKLTSKRSYLPWEEQSSITFHCFGISFCPFNGTCVCVAIYKPPLIITLNTIQMPTIVLEIVVVFYFSNPGLTVNRWLRCLEPSQWMEANSWSKLNCSRLVTEIVLRTSITIERTCGNNNTVKSMQW